MRCGFEASSPNFRVSKTLRRDFKGAFDWFDAHGLQETQLIMESDEADSARGYAVYDFTHKRMALSTLCVLGIFAWASAHRTQANRALARA